MNFGRFTEQLESFLALEQRGRWCAVGLVDITGFKWYNDALGHAVGDRIIERVAAAAARAGRGPTTSSPRSAPDRAAKDLHARFGGDEFCFLIPDLAEYHQAYAVAERFREAVERYDWTLEDQPARRAAGARRRRRRLPAARARRRAPVRRPPPGGRADSARRQVDVRGQERARQPHPHDALRVEDGDLIEITDGPASAAATALTVESDNLVDSSESRQLRMVGVAQG